MQPRTVDRLTLDGAVLPLVDPTRVYVCGITPYDVTHLGHASTFAWADLLARVIRLTGAGTVVTRNVTDVDDVLTRAAHASDRDYDSFALTQEFWFERDLEALRVRRPTHTPHARHHVRHVAQLAAALLTAGAAYERAGTVYFRGAAVPAAAGLSRPDALARAAEYGDDPDDPARDDPFDVPIWRAAGTNTGSAAGAAGSTTGTAAAAPSWPSPWGPGRPGWHAGCAAMAIATLGGTVDVLAGGADLVFPHHAYVAAMASAALGVAPFARRRLSVGEVRYQGRKMAKSTGNLVLVGDLLREHSAAAVRLVLLNRRWSQAWEFEPAALEGAAALEGELYAAAAVPGEKDDDAVDRLTAALLDDLDVPTAVGVALESRGAAARLLLRTLALQ